MWLCVHADGYRGSIKMHKDREGPLVLGPIWDLNEAFGLCCGYPIEGKCQTARRHAGHRQELCKLCLQHCQLVLSFYYYYYRLLLLNWVRATPDRPFMSFKSSSQISLHYRHPNAEKLLGDSWQSASRLTVTCSTVQGLLVA
jgi:hypothetical protein